MRWMAERSTYEEYLDAHGRLTYSNVGVSMLPLLRQGKDLFTVEKKGEARCKAGDVVLYRRPPDSYVLHRIVEVRPEDYVLLGDNCIAKEYGIRDGDILGVMSAFVRGGKTHSVREPGYRLYSALWLHTIAPRVFLKRCAAKLRHTIKRLRT